MDDSVKLVRRYKPTIMPCGLELRPVLGEDGLVYVQWRCGETRTEARCLERWRTHAALQARALKVHGWTYDDVEHARRVIGQFHEDERARGMMDEVAVPGAKKKKGKKEIS